MKTPERPIPSVVLLLGLLLGAVYLAAYRPMVRTSAERSKPLTNLWHQLMSATATNPACAGLTLENHAARLQQLRDLSADLEQTRRLVRSRIEPSPDIRARMSEPFLLIDFQNERLRLAEQLFRQAKEKGVECGPGATNGLPAYSVDLAEPALLWPRLQMASQILLAAIECKLTSVRALEQLPSVGHFGYGPGRPYLEETPMRVEITGGHAAISRFLACLPLRGDELQALGLGGQLTNKPALFIGRVLARKSAPDRPEELVAELRLSSFVPWVDGQRRASTY